MIYANELLLGIKLSRWNEPSVCMFQVGEFS